MFSGESEMQQNDAENCSERGSSRNVLLGALALLLALFGYLYFFTGVIKQRGETPPPQAPQQVKQPLPPRTDSPAPPKAAEAPATAANTAQPAPAPAKPAEPQPKQQGAAPKPVQTKAASPVPQPQKPVVAPPKPAAAEKKPAAAPPKGAAVKPEAAKAPAKEPLQKETAKKPVVMHRIVSTEIVSLQKADRVVEQLKKAGLGNVRKETRLTARPMNRLLVTEFTDRAAAGVELAKLRKSSPGAFILPSNGKYELYAGSYDKEKGAESEKKRLEAQGFKLTLQKADVRVPAYQIRAQATSKEMADESLRIIRKLGAEATATRTGK